MERISAWVKEGSVICIDTSKKAITNDRNDRKLLYGWLMAVAFKD